MRPFVSVIIPGYKKEYIQETIESVLQQTYTNYEIIVVDDGSPYNLKEVLKDYITQNKIRYIYQENKKMAGAKNTGIRHSQGTLIAFLDDDDLWDRTKLEKQIPLFQDPQVGICYTWSKSFQSDYPEKMEEMSISKIKIVRPEFEQLLLSELFFPSSSVMVRKEALDKVGCFNETPEYYGVDDSDLWIRICFHYKAMAISEPLMFYRLHKNQFSIDMTPMHIRAISMRNKLIDEFKLNKKISYKQTCTTYIHIGYAASIQNKKLTALKYYLKAIFYEIRLCIILAIIKLIIPNRIKLFIKEHRNKKNLKEIL